MSFTEKSLWISLLLPLGFWLWYFARLLLDLAGPTAIDQSLHLTRLWIVLGVTIVIQLVVLGAVAAKTARLELQPDERERVIADRGAARAYMLMTAGILVLVLGAGLGWDGFTQINTLVFIYLVAEIIRILTELRLHRRGFPG